MKHFTLTKAELALIRRALETYGDRVHAAIAGEPYTAPAMLARTVDDRLQLFAERDAADSLRERLK